MGCSPKQNNKIGDIQQKTDKPQPIKSDVEKQIEHDKSAYFVKMMVYDVVKYYFLEKYQANYVYFSFNGKYIQEPDYRWMKKKSPLITEYYTIDFQHDIYRAKKMYMYIDMKGDLILGTQLEFYEEKISDTSIYKDIEDLRYRL